MSNKQKWGQSFRDNTNSNQTSQNNTGFSGFQSGNQNTNTNMNTQNNQGFGFKSNGQNFNAPNVGKPPKKKGKIKKFFIMLLVFLLTLTGVYFIYNKFFAKPSSTEVPYTQTARYAYDQMTTSWGKHNNVKNYKEFVKEPWITQEIAYFNGDKQKKAFYDKILDTVEFKYDTIEIINSEGVKVDAPATYNDEQMVKMLIPDYEAITHRITYNDFEAIQQGYKALELDKKNYMYEEKMTEFFIYYMMSFEKLPTKMVSMELTATEASNAKELAKSNKPIYTVVDDKKLDKVLFSSEAFQDLQTVFAAAANGDIGKTEKNPAHETWVKSVNKYKEDKLKYNVEQVKKEQEAEKQAIQTEKLKAEQEAKTETTGTEEATKNTEKKVNAMGQETKTTESGMKVTKKETDDTSSKEDGTKVEVAKVEIPKELAVQFNEEELSNMEKGKTKDFEASKSRLEFVENKFIFVDVVKELKDKEEKEKIKLEETEKGTEVTKEEDKKDGNKEEEKKEVPFIERKPEDVAKERLNEEFEGYNNLTDPTTLTDLEKVVGVEPSKTIFVRKQEETEAWKEWNKLGKEAKKDKVTNPEPTKTVNIPLKPQENIPFTWIGAYNLQNDYIDKDGNKVKVKPQRGNGTFKKPASIGTVVMAKAFDIDGREHDVKVNFKKILTEKDAIKYVTDFDNRNIGFDSEVENKLVVIEYELENLEDKEQTLVSGFMLADKEGNEVPRSGRMYSLRNEYKFKPGEKVLMQDWFYAKDINNKYLTWGKGFNKKYPTIWFDTLAFDKKKEEDTKGEEVTEETTSEEVETTETSN